MIEIRRIAITSTEGKSRLSADVVQDGEIHPLWFEVDDKYGKYLCDERSDAFVVGLLHYALREGHDIVSDVPMTRRLYEQITDQFLPAFSKANGIRKITIDVPLADEIDHPDDEYHAGGGVSCGVDSLHVFAMHKDLTHGCIWNMHGVTSVNETPETRALGWRNLKQQAEAFTKYIGCGLVVGDTNYDRGCLPKLRFDGSVTFGNLFCVFAMQKFWSRYYIASTYDVDEFNIAAGINADPAHYEFLLLSQVSLRNITFRLDGAACNRCEKVRDLLGYEPSKKFLTVCWSINERHENCTHHCPKCMRTVLDLAAWDAVDAYDERFDVKAWHEHQEWFVAELYRGLLQGDPFAKEIAPYFKMKPISLRIKIKASFIVIKKFMRKVFRFGRTNLTFRPD